ncbi:MAG: hypothetical protein AB1345_00695 [Chloroflexota bacterium]
MQTTSRRFLLSCAVILLVVCLCLSVLSIGGAIFLLIPQIKGTSATALPDQATFPAPQLQQTPTITGIEPATTPVGSDLPPTTPIGNDLPPNIARQTNLIEEQIINLRGWQPTGPVTRTLLNQAQLHQHVLEDFQEDYTAEEAYDDTLTLAAFGLLEPTFDLYNFYIELYSEQIAGFYDDDVKQMFVVQDDAFDGPERMTYAHEYVHVLQDQIYDFDEGLNYNDDACEEDSERCAAIQALIEGDATFTEINWLITYATDQDRQEIFAFYNNYSSPVYDSSPDFLKADFLFPYDAGQEFVEYLYNRGGWDAINQAYLNPPLSTEQILHPERYPQDIPITVTLPDLTQLLGEGWREIDHGVLGEWYTFLVLAHGTQPSTRLKEDQAYQAADGWEGDAYAVYYNDNFKQTVLVLSILWEGPNDANQFVAAFNQYANARFGSSTGSRVWNTPEAFSVLYINDSTTTWLLTPNPTLGEEVARALGLP